MCSTLIFKEKLILRTPEFLLKGALRAAATQQGYAHITQCFCNFERSEGPTAQYRRDGGGSVKDSCVGRKISGVLLYPVLPPGTSRAP